MADPNSSTRQRDISDHLRVLERRKFVVLAVFVVAIAFAGITTFLRTPAYTATARLLIQRPQAATGLDPVPGQRLSAETIAEIEIEFFGGDTVSAEATKTLGYDAKATATSTTRGSVMQISATNTNPQRAADIANAYAVAYIGAKRKVVIDDYATTGAAIQTKIDAVDARLAALDQQETARNPVTTTAAPKKGETAAPPAPASAEPGSAKAERDSIAAQREALVKQLGQYQVIEQSAQTGGPIILSPADVPTSPSSPQTKRDIALGGVLGLLLGIAAAFLVDLLDDTIKNREDLELASPGVPVLTTVPQQADWKSRSEAQLASIEHPSSPAAEAYRSLRTSVQFAGLDRPLKILQVTSSRAAEGKSTTSANLAVALARTGLRIIIVDCDLRRPRAHEFLGCSNTIGFTSLLLGAVTIEEALADVPGVETLKLLPSGPIPPNPSELLSGRKTAEVIGALRDQADMVIVDTPPILPVADALAISDLMDGIVLVANVGSTRRKELSRSIELLRQVDGRLIGTVLNGDMSEGRYGYGYGYSYGYSRPYAQSGSSKRRKGSPKQADSAGPTASTSDAASQSFDTGDRI